MAKNIGIIQISGKLGNLQFSKKNGQSFVGMTSSIDKKRIQKDPAFKRTRENMAEFGGAATVSKQIREKMIPLKSLIEKNLHNRFTSMLREMVNFGSGARGKRAIEFSINKELLAGFELNETTVLSEVFQVPIEVTSNANRNQLVLTIPEFLPGNGILIPEGATHFKMHFAGLAMSDFGPQGVKNKYLPLNSAQHGIFDKAETAEIPVDALVTGGITLQIDLPGSPTLDPDVSLAAMVGIEFMQIINNDYYLFASNNAIRIEKLF